MINHELAHRLNQIADILEFRGVEWKPRAYRAAARSIKELGQNIDQLYQEQGKKGLQNIPGVGSSLADHIAEWLEKGRVKRWEKLEKKAPGGAHKLSQIEGLGPKKVKKLIKKLDIKSVADLKKAVKQHKIRKMQGFGRKSEENIIQAIKQFEAGSKRMQISTAMQAAHEVISYLKENTDIKKLDYAGSLRRMKQTIGDIDILVVNQDSEKVMEKFVNMPDVQRVVSKGKTRSTVILKQGIHVDLRAIASQSYGSAMLYFTGSKDHNIALRNLALKKNYKLSEYGLFSKKSGRRMAGRTEKQVYKKLGLSFIPPEMRENRGEVELAQKNKIPRLINMKDVRGDLQMHTKYSDGRNTLKEMMDAAQEKGYEYIAITDHSKSQRIAHGMDEKEIKKQWKEMDKAASRHKLKLLKGAEVDILPDGSLDYPDKLLKELDLVLAAIHSRFKSSEKEMTNRIVKALRNKHVNILAHPTGRIIGKRAPYNVNLDQVFSAAQENNKVLEINSDPARLDLNNGHLLKARKYNLKFSLGTDSHSVSNLRNMQYGIGIARRAWLTRKDIINTYSYKRLKQFLDKQ